MIQPVRPNPKPSARAGERPIVAATPKSYWWPAVRNLFFSLNEIPLTALTAVSAVLGMGVLLRYFELIGFTPDVGALVGLSVAAALTMLLLLLTILFALQAPIWFVRAYELPLLSPLETICAQIVVFSILAVWVAWSQPPASGYLILFLLLLFCAFLALLLGSIGLYAKNAALSSLSSLVIGVGSLFPAYALLALIVMGAVDANLPTWLVWLGLTGALVVVSFVNGFSAHKTAGWKAGAVFSTVLVMLALFFVTPTGFVPSTVATLLGLRMKGEVNLRVGKSSCLTIMSAAYLHAKDVATSRWEEDAEESCREFGNRVNARVDLRWGNRWLLQVRSINGMNIDPAAPRITIPDLGTELVLTAGQNQSSGSKALATPAR